MPFLQEAPQLQEFLDGVSEGIIAVDPAWRILYVNAAGERILGKPRQELLGQELWKALPEEEASLVRRGLAARDGPAGANHSGGRPARGSGRPLSQRSDPP